MNMSMSSQNREQRTLSEETEFLDKYERDQEAMLLRELTIDRIKVKEGASLMDMRYQSPMSATQGVDQIIAEKFGGKRSLGNTMLAQAI